ncbi:MAG: LysR family transcriptional regulator [Candidatus Eisenbacteria bacterium]|uniref:LysR family transcriptional regulator n=1 Tax=Eiseniibacteriota bacterium TaxID=2212470 RepID=A0A948RUQ9_UNCEI|nr:LysR family transcriptional regulator [Candidatus Eisenbacteria bacterium]MBU1947097.1 LysR family transcriptional regulator [Candidatus Eisenbacteria bacterium]MBU2689307.1 LysR family transcriptional regulator [Candidatus Eisenbacteria bacterium]
MDFRQLQYFIAVAEELHFSKAAQRLHMTQPPLSLQIQRLEQDLQVRLFERTKRSVKLTPAGAVLLKEAQPILDRVEMAAALCRRADTSEMGTLAIGLVPIALDLLIGRLARGYRERHPDIRLSLHEMGTNEQLRELQRGGIQVGFIQTCGQDLSDLESLPVISEPYHLAVPRHHALARRKRITVQDLRDVNLILPPRPVQPRVYDAIVGSCRQAGFEPLLDYSVYGKHAALSLVAEGLGVTPICPSYLGTPVPGIVTLPMDAGWPPMEIRMVWVPGTADPVLERFLELARKEGKL